LIVFQVVSEEVLKEVAVTAWLVRRTITRHCHFLWEVFQLLPFLGTIATTLTHALMVDPFEFIPRHFVVLEVHHIFVMRSERKIAALGCDIEEVDTQLSDQAPLRNLHGENLNRLSHDGKKKRS
jgi:hypothetical protein